MTLSEAWVDFLAGWASGAVGVLALQPVDTVLTRLQAGPFLTRLQQAGPAVAAASATATPASAASTTAATGTAAANCNAAAITTYRQITAGMVRNFGVTSLWRGASPMISAVPVQNSLLMGGYGVGKQWAALNGSGGAGAGTPDVLLPVFVGGCTGGVVQSFLMSPVEYVKVHQQVFAASNGTELATARAASSRLLHSRTLWGRGLTATLLRDGIPHGVWFASYEWCKTAMVTTAGTNAEGGVSSSGDGGGSGDSTGVYQHLAVPIVSGAFAATVAWVRVCWLGWSGCEMIA
jgi:solute carrier family 25 (mitochondrial carnitine/acylcarnitine transporter), member 20/29